MIPPYGQSLGGFRGRRFGKLALPFEAIVPCRTCSRSWLQLLQKQLEQWVVNLITAPPSANEQAFVLKPSEIDAVELLTNLARSKKSCNSNPQWRRIEIDRAKPNQWLPDWELRSCVSRPGKRSRHRCGRDRTVPKPLPRCAGENLCRLGIISGHSGSTQGRLVRDSADRERYAGGLYSRSRSQNSQ
jgi:hypothetical protein